MKAFTDIEQSKKLAEILPLESADMCFANDGTAIKIDAQPYNVRKLMWKDVQLIPCWSLSALLSIIKPVNDNTYTLIGTLDGGAMISFDEVTNVMFQEEEIIDAVFEMVVWLKEKH